MSDRPNIDLSDDDLIETLVEILAESADNRTIDVVDEINLRLDERRAKIKQLNDCVDDLNPLVSNDPTEIEHYDRSIGGWLARRLGRLE